MGELVADDDAPVYRAVRLDVVELYRALDPAALRLRVAATPAWSVLDVLAHVVGITVDLNAGRLGDGDADTWTAAQVASRRGRSVADLVEEWRDASTAFEAGLRLFGVENHYVADLLQHSQDVRGTVGAPRIADPHALAVGLGFYLDDLDERLRTAGVGLVIVADAQRWSIGRQPADAALTTTGFEAFRAIGGRRSLVQLRALEWNGDVDRVLPLISAYPVPVTELD